MTKKKALIFGISGQDAYYLSKFLVKKKYTVYGVKKKSKTKNYNIAKLKKILKKKLYVSDISINNFNEVKKIIKKINPDEIYNLAAQSHVGLSFKKPIYTNNVNFKGVKNILESILLLNNKIKFFQASSSEILNKNNKIAKKRIGQNKLSPYAISKIKAHNLVNNFKKKIFCVNGILFNHESPLRKKNFVTRKITKIVAKISKNKKTPVLYLGNIDTFRDWGHAEDYVKAMWKMLQINKPLDFMICTGKIYSVRFFIEECFRYIGYKIFWEGKNLDEIGYIIFKKKKKNYY